MRAMKEKFWILLASMLCLAVGVKARQDFYQVDWTGTAERDSIPEVRVMLDLPEDYRAYDYEAVLEFPELVKAEPSWQKLAERNGLQPEAMPQLQTQLCVGAGKGYLRVDFVPMVRRDGVLYRVESYALKLKKNPYALFAGSRLASDKVYAEHSLLSRQRVVKIRVDGTGVYRITDEELRAMGFQNPEQVRVYGYGGNCMDGRFENQPDDDLPVAPARRAGNALLFYARGTVHWEWSGGIYSRVQNFYSNEAYYFLSEDAEAGMAVTETDATGTAAQVLNTADAYALYEKDRYSWSTTGRELYDDYNFSSGTTQTYSFTLPDVTGDDGKVKVVFSSKSTRQNVLKMSVGGTEIARWTLSSVSSGDTYRKAAEDIVTATWKGSKSEKTTVTLELSANEPARLNYLILNYRRKLNLREGWMAFRASESVGKETTFVVSGANAATEVWDVTDRHEMKLLKGTLSGSEYRVTVPAEQVLRELVAVNTASADFGKVTVVGEVPRQDLHALSGVQMVIITPERFWDEANRLAEAHREADGLNVAVVKSKQVYNEFSSGTPDVTAYRRLLKMLYDRAGNEAERPAYLLLFGDCAYDNRMVSDAWAGYSPDDFLLCYQDANSTYETESYLSDDYIGMLDDGEGTNLKRDVLDVAIGRFPVRTLDEAKAMVDKTIAYMNGDYAGAWRRSVCYLADDSDGGNYPTNDFMVQADRLATIAEQQYPQGVVKRLLPDAFVYESTAIGGTYPEARRLLYKYLDEGLLVLNYTGHSNTTSWSVENLLTMDDVASLKSPNLALWVTASCEFSRMDAANQSGGELVLLKENSGAIGMISATRVVYDGPNQNLNNAMTRLMFQPDNGKGMRLGDILRKAKVELASQSDFVNSNKMNFVLLGDPAVRLAVPGYRLQVDEMETETVDGKRMLQAGGQATVRGRVLTPDGQPAEDFNGLVYPMVFDSKETVNTLDGKGAGVLTYQEFSKVLFNSTDSVRKGAFEFTFPVPLDIKYSNEQGMLSLYALADDRREAGGWYGDFYVGGTSGNMSDDQNGPKVQLYLNEPGFVWGGQVNETPYFVAELEDADGINTVGNGIGHDLALIIDGVQTYNLNDYYVPVSGDYTRGKVAYSIPELDEGKHKLQFRAWDILNNSSLHELEFEVVKGLCPNLFDVTVTESPARQQTTFILSHDRPGSQVQVTISVFDYAGRVLWTHEAGDVPESGYYRVDWDLTTGSGQRLGPGVYLYRATMASPAGEAVTQTRKIVILAQ